MENQIQNLGMPVFLSRFLPVVDSQGKERHCVKDPFRPVIYVSEEYWEELKKPLNSSK